MEADLDFFSYLVVALIVVVLACLAIVLSKPIENH
jgi:hypothetical protein